jgi:hypothetical protein
MTKSKENWKVFRHFTIGIRTDMTFYLLKKNDFIFFVFVFTYFAFRMFVCLYTAAVFFEQSLS